MMDTAINNDGNGYHIATIATTVELYLPEDAKGEKMRGYSHVVDVRSGQVRSD